MVPSEKRIYIVDEHPVMVAGLHEVLQSQPGWHVAGAATSCDAALYDLERTAVDLIILEPGVDGMDGLGRLSVMTSRTRVFCFSTLNEQLMAERALREGARGFLMKTCPVEELVDAIQLVLGGGIALSGLMRQQLIGRLAGVDESNSPPTLQALSNRELQVVHLIGFNRNSRQIARHMHVSEKTVATHRLRIREKLKLRSSNDLIRIATRWVGQDSLS